MNEIGLAVRIKLTTYVLGVQRSNHCPTGLIRYTSCPVWWQYVSVRWQGVPIWWQYTSVQWQGNAYPVASMQVLIDRTPGELCNVMETHLSEFTFVFINC